MSPGRTTKNFRARLMSRLRATTFLVGWGSIYCIGHPALANPQGGTVVAGQATITTPAPNTVTIDQSTKIVIVDWNSFDIGKGETTRFNQPDASSTAVNRIGGNDPSVILGNLNANGRVILINGNGLLFGAGAKINVGSLIATTHDASNADLMSGKANFDGPGSPTASITNNGRINASSGIVGLIAPAVTNNGTIQARLGSVTLGAASKFTLDFTGDGLISFPVDADVLSRALDASGKPVKALVINRGRIEGGTVLLTARAAKDIVENVISMGGLVRATGAHQSGGSIILDGGDGGVSVSGTLNASDAAPGAVGGTIKVLGDSVTLTSSAQLAASGDAGGGTILVGGNAHGAGPERNATTTVVAAGARLKADAITSGSGGTVVVWSDKTTNFAGAISARGGVDGGNGGFVETSGKQSLTVADGATVDTLAPKGLAGDWLLDPANITIASSGSGTLTQGADTTDTTSSVTISSATINAATSNVILAASNSIAVNSTINIANHVGITFEGSGSTPTTGPSLGTTLSANVTTSLGAITIDGPTFLGADVTLTAGGSTLAFNGALDGAHNLTTAGPTVIFGGAVGGSAALTSLTANSTSGVTFDGNVTLAGITSGAGLAVNNASATLGGAVTINGGTGSVTFTHGLTGGGYALTVTATGAIAFGGGASGPSGLASLTTTSSTSTNIAGSITTNNGAITINGPAIIGNNTTGFTLSTGTGAVEFNGTVDAGTTVGGTFLLTVSNTGGTTFESTVGAARPLTSLTTNGGGATTFDGNVTTNNGAVSIGKTTTGPAGATTLGGDITISAGSGAVTFNGAVDGAHNLTISNSGAVTFDSTVGANTALASLATGTGTTTFDGNVTTTNGGVTIGGATTLGADVTITAGTGAVDFAGTVDGAHILTVSNSGGDTFGGVVGGTAALTGLTTGTGTTTIDGNITTTNGAITIKGPTIIGNNATGFTLNTGTGAVDFKGTVDGASSGTSFLLTTTNTGGTTFESTVGATTPLTSLTTTSTGTTTFDGNVTTNNGSVSIGGPTTLGGDVTISAGSGGVTFTGAVSGAYALTISNSGSTAFNAGFSGLTGLTTGSGTATVSGGASVSGPTLLGGNLTITAGSHAVSFSGTIDGAHVLSITDTGGVTFGGAVGTTTSALAGLSTGTGLTTLDGNVSTTNGAVKFGGATTLGSDITISAGPGLVTFTGAVNGAHNLTVSNSGGVTFDSTAGATTALASLTTGTGTTTFDGNVTTTNGGVTIGGATTLGGSVTISAGTGAVTFTGAVEGTRALVITNSGGVAFDSTVGANTALASLSTGTGTTTLDGNVSTTNGAVKFGGATTLGSDITISAGTGLVTFSGAVEGAHNVIINNSGAVTFDSTVGANTALASLATGTGTTTFDGNVTTTNGNITVNGATTLGGAVTISAGTGAVDFAGAVSSADALIINNSGGVTFGATTLGGDATINAGTGAVNFVGTVDGAYNLIINNSGGVTFGGAIGAVTGPASLSTGTGTTTLDGDVGVSGAIIFDGPVALGADVLINGGFTNSVTFMGAVNGGHNLTFTDLGTVTFDSTVGAATPLTSLTLGESVSPTFDGNVTLAGTTGVALSIMTTTTLGGNVTVNGGTGSVSFGGGVTGGGYALDVTTTSVVTFGNTLSGLASLTTTGSTTINSNITTANGGVTIGGAATLGGNITTTNGAITINGPTIIGNNTTGFTLSTGTGAVEFNGTVNGASSGTSFKLTTTNTGGTTFDSTVGATTPLTRLTTGTGTTTLDGNVSTTNGSVTIGGATTLGSDVTFSTGSGAVTFTGAVSGAYALTISNSGSTAFNAGFSGLTGLTTGSGTTTVSGGASVSGPTLLGGNLTITAGSNAVRFSGTVDGAHVLSITDTGGVTFGGVIGGTAGLTSLTTGMGTTTIDGNVSTTNGNVTIGGPTTLGGDVTISAGSGAVTFTGAVDGAHNLTITNSGGVTFDSTVGANTALASLTTGTGTTTLDGNITTTNGNVALGGATTLGAAVTITAGTGAVDFAGTVNGAHNLTVSNTGTTTLDGNISAGTITFNGPVTLGADITISTASNRTFSGPVNGAHNLTINANSAITVTFDSTVGATTPLTSLTLGPSVSPTFDGNVTLAGNSTTGVALSIMATTTLGGNVTIGGGTGSVSFGGGITGGGYALDVTTLGATTFGVGVTGLTGLTTTAASTTINSNITTTNGAITVNGPTIIANNEAGFTLSTGTGAVEFNGTVDGANSGSYFLLTTTNTGGTKFDSTVGATTALTGLSTTSTGTTTFDGNVKTNNGSVSIGGPTTLGADVTISAGSGAVTFTGAVDGAHNLTITNSGGVTFDSTVGANTALASLTTTTTTTTLYGNISTTNGSVTFNGATTLGGDVTISAGSDAISFNGTVDGAHNLVLTTSGTMLFSGVVGGGTSLGSLKTTGTGQVQLNGNVTTTGVQSYGGPVQLLGPLIMEAGAANVTFASTLQSSATPVDYNSLTVDTSGSATFNGVVDLGGELLRTGAGPTFINANITTASEQIYRGAVTLDASSLSSTDSTGSIEVDGATTLGGDVTISAGTAAISFYGPVDGAHNLVLTTSGTMLFDGVVGGGTALASLTTGTGTTQLNGNITTTGIQSYDGPVRLLGPLIMEAGAANVTFASTLQSSATPVDQNSLTVDTSGVATFNGVVDLGGELQRTGTGTTFINANITTASAQYYQGPVTLNALALSSTDSTGSIEVGGGVTLAHDATVTAVGVAILVGVDGHYNLTVDSDQSVLFRGAVGANTPLASLTTGGATGLYGNVTTTGAQSYGARVVLRGNVAIRTTDAPVSFASTIDSSTSATARNLSVTTGAGAQTYGGALGSIHALGSVTLSSSNAASLSLASTANNIASVSVTAGGAVTIADSGPLTVTGINTTGDVLVTTQSGDLTITGIVATTSTTATALTLEAGSSADRVASPGTADTNGNVVIAGGSLSIGAGGFGTIYTGSITGSTGLSNVVGAGNFRYWSDTNGNTGYSTPLNAGISAIYREQPVVTVTATAADSGRAYDGTTTTPTVSVTGLVNGDVGSATGTISVTNSSGAPVVLLNAGSYTLGVTNASASGGLAGLGYAVQAGGVSSNYVIVPATLTITGVAAADKTYDGTTAATLSNIGSLTGLVGGETLTLTSGAANFADANAGTGKTVTVTGYAIANGTGLASNYVLGATTATTTATISPAILTAGVAGNVAKSYDGTTTANLNSANYTLAGTIYGSDVVTLNDPTSGTYADANAGTAKTVTVAGLAVSNANYALASTTASAAIGTISPAILTAGLTGTVAKTYDGTSTANLNSANYTLAGTIYGSDVVALNDPTSGTYADANAGTAKTVTVAGLAVSNANYALAFTTASAAIGTISPATAPITPAVATVGLTSTISVRYESVAAANSTVPDDISTAPPITVPANFVGSLYVDSSNVIGNASLTGNAPSIADTPSQDERGRP